MFRFTRRARPQATEVEFCDTCSQVCTPACRAHAQRERTQTMAAQWAAPLR